MLHTLVVAAFLGLPLAPAAELSQPERAVAPELIAQKEAMKKLEWLAGDWEGMAKYDTGRGGGEDAWMSIHQSETVRVKMGGRVLLVEGAGRVKAGEEERVVYEALGTISYDPATKEYKMRAFGPEGAVDPKFEVGEKSAVWGFTTRAGKMKYTVKLDEQGRWKEIGERSADDGKTWTKFVDMTLEKKK